MVMIVVMAKGSTGNSVNLSSVVVDLFLGLSLRRWMVDMGLWVNVMMHMGFRMMIMMDHWLCMVIVMNYDLFFLRRVDEQSILEEGCVRHFGMCLPPPRWWRRRWRRGWWV